MSQVLETFNKVSSIIKELLYCTEKEDIEKVFSNNNINDFSDRINILRKTMKVEQVFYTGKKKITLEDEYQYELDIFVEGSWRLLA